MCSAGGHARFGGCHLPCVCGGRGLFLKPCNGVQNGLRHGVYLALLQKAFVSVHRGQRRRHGGAFERAARLQSDGGSASLRQGACPAILSGRRREKARQA